MDANEISTSEQKKRIQTAALELFGSRGYAGTRIQDIAEKAQVHPADIYKFYASKRDLFDALQHPEFDFPDLAEKEKREAILKKALELFSSQGIANTSMDEIAAGLKMTKPALYYYYPSKEALFRTILEQPIGFVVLMPLIEELRANATLTLEDGLERIADAYLSLFYDPGFAGLMKMVLSEGMHEASIAEIFSEKVIQRGSGLLVDLLGRFLALERKQLIWSAQCFMQSLFGLGLTNVLMSPKNPASRAQMDEAARRLVQQFMHGIDGYQNPERESKEDL
jgi:TetR/AcrR family transcriptional regulator, mexJK operon transcriptional repressor